jgi:hypothetical protein
MSTEQANDVARRARAIYDAKLREKLTATNSEEFVAIEPDSGDFFVRETLSEAVQAARAAHPNRLPFTLRIGHEATVELGILHS